MERLLTLRELRDFLSNFLIKNFSISADYWVMHLKSRGEIRLHKVFSPDDSMKELVFCAVPRGLTLVNLSSNIHRIRLNCRYLPVCLPHSGSSFQGHLKSLVLVSVTFSM